MLSVAVLFGVTAALAAADGGVRLFRKEDFSRFSRKELHMCLAGLFACCLGKKSLARRALVQKTATRKNEQASKVY